MTTRMYLTFWVTVMVCFCGLGGLLSYQLQSLTIAVKELNKALKR